VRILATLLRLDGGHAAVLGHDVVCEAAAVRRIARAGQSATVDEDLTGRENLLFLGRLSGLARVASRSRRNRAGCAAASTWLTTQYLERLTGSRTGSPSSATGPCRGHPSGLKADTGKGTLDEVFLALTQDPAGSAA